MSTAASILAEAFGIGHGFEPAELNSTDGSTLI
jgi:hypothetical protein